MNNSDLDQEKLKNKELKVLGINNDGSNGDSSDDEEWGLEDFEREYIQNTRILKNFKPITDDNN